MKIMIKLILVKRMKRNRVNSSVYFNITMLSLGPHNLSVQNIKLTDSSLYSANVLFNKRSQISQTGLPND